MVYACGGKMGVCYEGGLSSKEVAAARKNLGTAGAEHTYTSVPIRLRFQITFRKVKHFKNKIIDKYLLDDVD